MKTIKKSTLLILSFALLAVACNTKQMLEMVKQQQLKVVPNPLEVHADDVKFNVSAKVPVKKLKKKIDYAVDFLYKPATADAVVVGTKTIERDDFKGKEEEVPVSQDFTFKYQDAYERGEIQLKGRATKKGKTQETDVLPGLAQGIITTSRLGQPNFYVSYLETPALRLPSPKVEQVTQEFFFDKGKTDFKKEEMNSDRAKKLEQQIAAAKELVTKSFTITGAHSPEGPEAINDTLAKGRARVIEKYCRDLLARYDYKDKVKSINFISKPVFQDWTAFKAAVNATDKLTAAQKTEVLAIVNQAGDFVQTELKLQKLSYYTKVIEKEIYPPLRQAKVEILVEGKPEITEPEIIMIAGKIAKGQETPDKLKDEYIIYAAGKTADVDEKEALYKALVSKNSANYLVYNNLGAIYLDKAKKAATMDEKMKLLETAGTNLELSVKAQATPEAQANLAGVKMMKGDTKGALEMANKISGGSPNVVAMKNFCAGYVQIQMAQYDAAIASFSAAGNDAAVLYNKGLAQLLKSSQEMKSAKADFQPAMDSFEAAKKADANYAHAYYGAAIAAARMKEAAKVGENLMKACSMHAKLKDRAVTDLEFRDFATQVKEATK